MAQLLSVKNNQIITRAAVKNQHLLTSQENTSFVIELQTAQPLPQVHVEQDKTQIILNSGESLTFDTWQNPELYLQTSEQQYKLVYGQWTVTESFPLDIVQTQPQVQPLAESVTLTQTADNINTAQLGGLIGSTNNSGLSGWAWGGIGLGVLALGGLGVALSNSGGSDKQDNHRPNVSIKGEMETGHTLTAEVNNTDKPADNITYQWYADGKPIAGANSKTYTLTEADKGKNISVDVIITDKAGNKETLKSGDVPDNNQTPPNNTSDNSHIPNNPPPFNEGKLGTYVPKPTTNFVANAKDYGAKGDGKTDDTAAIQKAIDDVAAKGGGVVDIPAGIFMIDGLKQIGEYGVVGEQNKGRFGLALRSNVTVRMADSTVLKVIPNDAEGYSIFTLYNVQNANIVGGTLVGDRYHHKGLIGQYGYGIRILSSQNVVVENVTAKDFWGDGFYIGINSGINKQSENIVLYDVTADNNRRQGLSITDGKSIKVLNSEFKNTNGHMPLSGIDVEPNPGRTVSDIEIRENRFINNSGFGVIVSGSQFNKPNSGYAPTVTQNIIIENNVMSGNRDGIWVGGIKGGRITGNQIQYADALTSPTGGLRILRIDELTENIEVHGNTIYGGGDPKNGGAIVDLGKNNSVSGNVFKAAVHIRGVLKSGELLTAQVLDGDRVPDQVQYKWYADGQPINGATAKTYRLTAAEQGKVITVNAEFTDLAGNHENTTSLPTSSVNGVSMNNPPTYVYLRNYTIPENKAGAVVGKIGTHDIDAGDTHTYIISDTRFEIVNGELKLKNDQSLDYNREKSISLTITSTDRAGARHGQEITLKVEDDPNYSSPTTIKKTLGLAIDETDLLQPNVQLVSELLTPPEAPITLTIRQNAGLHEPVQYNNMLIYKEEESLNVSSLPII